MNSSVRMMMKSGRIPLRLGRVERQLVYLSNRRRQLSSSEAVSAATAAAAAAVNIHNNKSNSKNADADADADRSWIRHAMNQIEADFTRSADTHLIKLDLPYFAQDDIHIYLKDESTHPTGSLKHRLARSLFLYGLCNGWIHQDTTIIESSSGSTAISEAYFARLLGLDFVAVVPQDTAHRKIVQIQALGGRPHFVARANQMHPTARQLVQDLGGPGSCPLYGSIFICRTCDGLAIQQ
eukprot:scaffold5980_cov192-Amphora_coffeaeformis.AAC.3